MTYFKLADKYLTYSKRSEQMVRPKVQRRIVKEPEHNCLKHGKIEIAGHEESIEMNLDEFEAIRLGDYHNIKQKEAAELMGISQPTFHRILNSARKKTAISLIEGREIEINNLNFNPEGNSYLCKSCGFEWQNPKKEYIECPDCKSDNIQIKEKENISACRSGCPTPSWSAAGAWKSSVRRSWHRVSGGSCPRRLSR